MCHPSTALSLTPDQSVWRLQLQRLSLALSSSPAGPPCQANADAKAKAKANANAGQACCQSSLDRDPASLPLQIAWEWAGWWATRSPPGTSPESPPRPTLSSRDKRGSFLRGQQGWRQHWLHCTTHTPHSMLAFQAIHASPSQASRCATVAPGKQTKTSTRHPSPSPPLPEMRRRDSAQWQAEEGGGEKRDKESRERSLGVCSKLWLLGDLALRSDLRRRAE